MVDIVSIVTSILGGLIIFYGLTSLFIKEKLYLSEASIACLVGILFGPLCAGLIDVDQWGDKLEITKQFTRVVIGVQVMAAGVALPAAYLKVEWKSLTILYAGVMTIMWIICGLLVWAIIPGLNFVESLMIAACFTPTDPILSNSIIHGKFAEKHVPAHVRNLISADSGGNDGLGAPFLYLAIYLLTMDTGAAIGKWFYWVIAANVIASSVFGFVVGYGAKILLQYSVKRKLIDKEFYLVFAIALSLMVMGLAGLVHCGDLLACFVAGNALTWDDWFRVKTEKSHLLEVVDMLLNMSIFVFIGATMPWSHFNNVAINITPWRLVVLAVLVLLFRRMPVMMALYKWIPAVHTWQEAAFVGWFGPIGVACIYYYAYSTEYLPLDGPNAYARQVMEPIIYFIVLSSIIVHGITIPLYYLGRIASKTVTQSNIIPHPHFHIPKIHIHHAHHAHHKKDSYHGGLEDIIITNGHALIDENICSKDTCALSSVHGMSSPQLVPCNLPCVYGDEIIIPGAINSHCSLPGTKEMKDGSCCDLSVRDSYRLNSNIDSPGCEATTTDNKDIKRLSDAYYLP